MFCLEISIPDLEMSGNCQGKTLFPKSGNPGGEEYAKCYLIGGRG